ncbi:short chain dehydrogenase [Williamsia sp. 1138]|uniref:SDR family oxidoreductase n=1 Tax=Williamsia sp. 1138 TaxID=1903117 RepID=UPI000A0F8D8F|nr:SDR family oxidoreductase [Williamsia sp. 1138]OZG30424.1 short chain dehydrogenase [Williamsia sp. 1138]
MTAIDHKPQIGWRRRTVERDGVRLAVFELGEPSADRPTVLLVHGWPDTHALWAPVADAIASRYHLVAYDTRGYGESDAPNGDAAYRLPELAADLFAVADAVSPDEPVHVVAHDWGSVQTWEAVTTPGAEDRIASFVSVSGPNLDHLGAWTREQLRRPTPKALAQALSQALSSAYTAVFQLPIVPKVLFAAGMRPAVWRKFLATLEGTDPNNLEFAPTFRADAVSGLRYYRANIRERLGSPNPRSTRVPVFEIVNTRDIALRKAIFANTHEYTDSLWRIDTPTGHWLPYTNPGYLADIATQFIESIRGADSSPIIDRARRHGAHQPQSGKLAVITGAGSGIGRETAYLLSEQGAEVILADINLDAAEKTAATITSGGGIAHAYRLDVADTDGFGAFAEEVTKKHGVADIVINNAGIGLAGHVLDATDEQIRRLVDINLMGVMTGSRVFGRKMVERGLGGQIVNLASAAAFTPQQGLGGYSATKAGVLMFSESLRAELAEHRIGVSAICPGIVDTNIVAATEFAGASADGQKQLQDKMSGMYHKRNFTPDRVAAAIVGAIESNAPVVPVTVEAKVGYRIYRFAPGLSRRMARTKLF